jgi:hypothetical protein
MSTASTDEAPGAAEWLGVALLCACAVLSALLELLFIGQFYVGTVIIPLVIIAGLAGNVLLPVWGLRIVHTASGAVLPVVCWLIPILALTMYNRPEGDVMVLGLYGQQWGFYGLLLIGAGAGFATIVVAGGGAAGRRRPGPPPVTPRRPNPNPNSRPAPGGRPARKAPNR